MTPEGYERLMAVFEAACARPSKDRAAFLDEVCAGNLWLRCEVEKLLRADERPEGLLEAPALNFASAIGPQVGPYRIEAKLGEGGMGIVFRAHDTKLNRPVAIKFLSGDLADAAARRRFQREAQTASALNHPHILTVHDVGEWEERQYLVTEYLEGGTLQDWATSGKWTWRQVVEMLVGVADGLATAHAAGILHRDIKPGNILIHRSGWAKLADFGLAKMTGVRAVGGGSSRTLTEGPTARALCLARLPICRPSRPRGSRWTHAAMSSRSGWCFTKPLPEAGRLPERPIWSYCRP
jgi:serine/threonine protein kinase